MLASAQGAVVGATDVGATVEFLACFGFVPVGSSTLPAAAAGALYDVDAPLDEVVAGAPGAEAGTVRVVAAPASGAAVGPFDRGAHAFDVYTTDIDASAAAATDAGHRCGPIGRVELGPLVMKQVTVHGPDGLLVVLIEANRRRPTLLDIEPTRRHSEGHSLVWTVDSIDAALPFWTDEARVTVPFDMAFTHPEVAVFMELPRAQVPLRMAMLCDDAVSPMRVELLEFPEPGDDGPARPMLPLRGGLHAVEWRVEDLDKAMATMPSASYGAVVEVDTEVHPAARGVRMTAPGGLVAELWQHR